MLEESVSGSHSVESDPAFQAIHRGGVVFHRKENEKRVPSPRPLGPYLCKKFVQAIRLRPRARTDTANDAVREGLFGAFGLDAEKEKVREQAAREEKLYRIKLFEPDLKLLGLSLLDAPDLDEKRLRKAFRERSRVLHPDVRDESLDHKGVPTVYELNAAFEALRKLL